MYDQELMAHVIFKLQLIHLQNRETNTCPHGSSRMKQNDICNMPKTVSNRHLVMVIVFLSNGY